MSEKGILAYSLLGNILISVYVKIILFYVYDNFEIRASQYVPNFIQGHLVYERQKGE